MVCDLNVIYLCFVEFCIKSGVFHIAGYGPARWTIGPKIGPRVVPGLSGRHDGLWKHGLMPRGLYRPMPYRAVSSIGLCHAGPARPLLNFTSKAVCQSLVGSSSHWPSRSTRRRTMEHWWLGHRRHASRQIGGSWRRRRLDFSFCSINHVRLLPPWFEAGAVTPCRPLYAAKA